MMKKTGAVLFLLILLMMTAVCMAEETGPAQRFKMPDFVVYDEAGGQIGMEDLIGKPTVINLFASWCPPCRAELPDFTRMIEAHGTEVNFLMAGLTAYGSDTREAITAMLAELGCEITPVYDDDGSLSGVIGSDSIPVTLFLDAEGYLLGGQIGMMAGDQLTAAVESLLE